MARAKQDEAQKRDQIKKAQGERDKLDGEWYAVDQDYRFTKAEIDVARYDFEEARRKNTSSQAKKEKRLDDLEARWAKLRQDLEDVNARIAAKDKEIAELEATRLAADKKQKEVFAEYNRLEDRLAKIQPGFVTTVRNLPVLDLANPSLKVNQIMPANLQDDVIFSGTPKVDRCTTCHLGIDKKGFETQPQPFTTHPNLALFLQGPHPIDKVGCTSCHQGRGRATGFVNAVHVPSTTAQEKEWGKKYQGSDTYHRFHFWDYPMMAKGHTEAQCVKCHQGVVEVPKAASLNTGRLLFEKYGCNGCHKVKGWEDLRKVGPDLTKIVSKTNEEWIFRWIKEPKGFRPTRMPQVWDVRTPDQDDEQMKARNNVEANAVVAYLVEKSGRETYGDRPPGDLGPGPQDVRDDRLPGLPPRGQRPARRGRDAARRDRAQGAGHGLLPHARAQPRRHRQQGQRGLALFLDQEPQGLLARDADAEPPRHRQGSGRRHRLPDEPARTTSSWPARGRLSSRPSATS